MFSACLGSSHHPRQSLLELLLLLSQALKRSLLII